MRQRRFLVMVKAYPGTGERASRVVNTSYIVIPRFVSGTRREIGMEEEFRIKTRLSAQKQLGGSQCVRQRNPQLTRRVSFFRPFAW
jgi:hypothetical protein